MSTNNSKFFLFGYNNTERKRTTMEQNKLTRYLSLKEVAEYLNMSLGYVRELAKDTIGYYRFGCRIYVDKNDLDKWIAAQKNLPKVKFGLRTRPGAGRDIKAQEKSTHSDSQEDVNPSIKAQPQLNIESPTPGKVANVDPVTQAPDKPDHDSQHYDIINFDDDDDDDDDQCSPSNS